MRAGLTTTDRWLEFRHVRVCPTDCLKKCFCLLTEEASSTECLANSKARIYTAQDSLQCPIRVTVPIVEVIIPWILYTSTPTAGYIIPTYTDCVSSCIHHKERGPSNCTVVQTVPKVVNYISRDYRETALWYLDGNMAKGVESWYSKDMAASKGSHSKAIAYVCVCVCVCVSVN